MMARLFHFLAFSLVLQAVMLSGALAQDQAAESRYFEANARAVDGSTLMAGNTSISLWGVQKIEGMSAPFMVAARTALDNAAGSQKVRCELKSRTENNIVAQCSNASDTDLGLFMLQQGFVTADRGLVYGTVFEGPYIQAEQQAEGQGLGVWAKGDDTQAAGGDSNLMLMLGFILFLCIIVTFAVLSILIMRGFQKVVAAQRDNMDMVSRERALRDKERMIFAMMLDSEIKSNKSKVEAYIAVYDEMMRSLKDTTRPPKYKKVGDIVQSQPALDRSVFDRNTDKLDILGDRLSSEVIHFYARIKTNPDYINLEPNMPLEEAQSIVEKGLKSADRLNTIADRLIDMFSQGGHSSKDY